MVPLRNKVPPKTVFKYGTPEPSFCAPRINQDGKDAKSRQELSKAETSFDPCGPELGWPLKASEKYS